MYGFLTPDHGCLVPREARHAEDHPDVIELPEAEPWERGSCADDEACNANNGAADTAQNRRIHTATTLITPAENATPKARQNKPRKANATFFLAEERAGTPAPARRAKNFRTRDPPPGSIPSRGARTKSKKTSPQGPLASAIYTHSNSNTYLCPKLSLSRRRRTRTKTPTPAQRVGGQEIRIDVPVAGPMQGSPRYIRPRA